MYVGRRQIQIGLWKQILYYAVFQLPYLNWNRLLYDCLQDAYIMLWCRSPSEKSKLMTEMREEMMSRGCYLPMAKPATERFDSNCITPVSGQFWQIGKTKNQKQRWLVAFKNANQNTQEFNYHIWTLFNSDKTNHLTNVQILHKSQRYKQNF